MGAVARATAVLSASTLIAFHGRIFAAQLADGRLENPGLIFRWLVAAGLIAALAALRRRGTSIWSRQGFATFLVALMLHGPSVAPGVGDAISSLAASETATSMLTSLASVAALAATLWLLAGWLAARRVHSGGIASAPLLVSSPPGIFGNGFSPTYGSRPPPALL